jgi:hypothetical protein
VIRINAAAISQSEIKWSKGRKASSGVIARWLPCFQTLEASMAFAPRFAWLILPLVLLLETAAQADDVQVGTGLLCDTQQQAERFAALYDGDAAIAIHAINAEEHNPTACGLVTMAYVPGPALSTTRTKDHTFQIIDVLVVGVATENGVQVVEPARFSSVVAVEELRA